VYKPLSSLWRGLHNISSVARGGRARHSCANGTRRYRSRNAAARNRGQGGIKQPSATFAPSRSKSARRKVDTSAESYPRPGVLPLNMC
jgi:hypothetical protein